ncbi:MAG: hypothetical protein ACRDE8_10150 [Ginsengibacter sp.]
MKTFLFSCIYLIFTFVFLPASPPNLSEQFSHAPYKYTLVKKGLFESDDILTIKLTGNLNEIMNDRAEKSKYHDLVLSYIDEDSTEISIPLQAKTRGHFRKSVGNCSYPPILLNFSKADSIIKIPSVFSKQHKLKLVMPCRGDEYVVREWLVYKLYNIITPESFKARLVKVELNNTKKKKNSDPFYGILLEDEEAMAKRNKLVLVNAKMMRPEETEPDAFLTMAVFEYFIGNTDWSIQYMQNIKFLAKDSNSICTTVPYDFDHAGLVDATYAKPAEELEMSSVRERRYRGYCITDMNKFKNVIDLFNHLKDDFYNLYTNCPFIDAKYIKATKQYFDDFYKTINNPKQLNNEFSYPCDKNGTGNIIIKGLK